MAKEGCPHGTGKQSPWHRRAVPMTQEGCRYGTGGHPHGTVEIPSDERKSRMDAHSHALAGIRLRTTNYTTTRGASKIKAT